MADAASDTATAAKVRPRERIHRHHVLTFGRGALGESDRFGNVAPPLGEKSCERSRLRLFLLPPFAFHLLRLSIQLLGVIQMPESREQIALHRERLRRRRHAPRQVERIGVAMSRDQQPNAPVHRIGMRREDEIGVIELALGVVKATLLQVEIPNLRMRPGQPFDVLPARRL